MGRQHRFRIGWKRNGVGRFRWNGRPGTGMRNRSRRLVPVSYTHLDVYKRQAGESLPEPLALRHYSGKFMVRIPPEVHRRLAIEAAESGVSLNRLASAKLSQE